MPFCINCGQQLTDRAKFCAECGAPVNGTNQSVQRKAFYDGEIHKCPNCGEVLNSFVSNCTSCGYELRGTNVSNAVKEFVLKLEVLESKREYENSNIKSSISKNQQLTKIDKQKINLIRNFSVPNTKEDLLEFIILAESNIRENRYDDELSEYEKELSDAWQAKFEQAYRKSKITFKDDKFIQKIEDIYYRKINAQKQAKRKNNLILAVIFIGVFLFIGIMFGGIFISDYVAIKNENKRLETIVEEVYVHIEQEQYILARSKVSSLVFSGSTTRDGNQAAAKWDITRQQLLDIIDKAEYGADYVIGPREIRIGVSQEDLRDEDYSEVKTQLENRGFTNVKAEAVEDLSTGWWTSEGSVDKVSIGGDTVFSKDSVYSSDIEIIVYYHAKK